MKRWSTGWGWVLAWGCGAPPAPPVPVQEPARVDIHPPLPPTPPLGARTLPLLTPPFDGIHPASNAFDHAVSGSAPMEVVDFRGVRLLGTGGHRAWDWMLPQGTPVLAMADGVVQQAGVVAPFLCRILGREVSDQLAVTVQHVGPSGEVIETAVHHLASVAVAPGEAVTRGQALGTSGNSGCSLGAHLHLDVAFVQDDRRLAVDPFGWQGAGSDPWARSPSGMPSVWLWQTAPRVPFEARRPPDATDGGRAVTLTGLRYAAMNDAAHRNHEFVDLMVDPRFQDTPVDLGGLQLVLPGGQTKTFAPGRVVKPGDTLRVYLGFGDDGPDVLHWNLPHEGLPDSGGVVSLQDRDGHLVDALSYGLTRDLPPPPSNETPSCPDPELGCVPLPLPGAVQQPVWSPDGRRVAVRVGRAAKAVVVPRLAGPVVVAQATTGREAPDDVAGLSWLDSHVLVFDAPGAGGGREVLYGVPGLPMGPAFPATLGDVLRVQDARAGRVMMLRDDGRAATLMAWTIDGGDPEPVTTHRLAESPARFDPAASQVVFQRNGTVALVALGSLDERTLTRSRDADLRLGWLGDRAVWSSEGRVWRDAGEAPEALLDGVDARSFATAPDGSAAVVRTPEGEVIRLAPDGTVAWRGRVAGVPEGDMAVVQADGAWHLAWVARFADGADPGLGLTALP